MYCRQARLVGELVGKVRLGYEMDKGLEAKVCMAGRGLLYYIFQLYRIVVGQGK